MLDIDGRTEDPLTEVIVEKIVKLAAGATRRRCASTCRPHWNRLAAPPPLLPSEGTE